MDTLLTFNDDAALIGNMESRVRTETRPPELSPEDWKEQLRANCLEAEHWYKDERGVPFNQLTGNYWYEKNGHMVAQTSERVVPYKNFSDESSGLSVRAAFLPDINQWVIDDREPESEDMID